MAQWRVTDHSEVPRDTGMVLGTPNREVQWLDLTTSKPVNDDVPYVSQTGSGAAAVLSCTKGRWHEYPTSYAYQWKLDGVNAGANSPTYDVRSQDVGATATCVVTATNEFGSTAAPPSNAIVIA